MTAALIAGVLPMPSGAVGAIKIADTVHVSLSQTAATPEWCSVVDRVGVSFVLAGDYRCGSFANGDPWVAAGSPGGVVGVSRVTPDAVAGSHGLMVNPSAGRLQAYDSRISLYDGSLVQAMPFAARGGQSLVKAVSTSQPCGTGGGHASCLQTAVVLTVLDEVPVDGGATVFRPPYFGSDKPLLST